MFFFCYRLEGQKSTEVVPINETPTTSNMTASNTQPVSASTGDESSNTVTPHNSRDASDGKQSDQKVKDSADASAAIDITKSGSKVNQIDGTTINPDTSTGAKPEIVQTTSNPGKKSDGDQLGSKTKQQDGPSTGTANQDKKTVQETNKPSDTSNSNTISGKTNQRRLPTHSDGEDDIEEGTITLSGGTEVAVIPPLRLDYMSDYIEQRIAKPTIELLILAYEKYLKRKVTNLDLINSWAEGKNKILRVASQGFKEPLDDVIPENIVNSIVNQSDTMESLETVFQTIIPPEHWFSGYCHLVISGNATKEDLQYDEVNSHMYALGHLATKPKESPTKKLKTPRKKKTKSVSETPTSAGSSVRCSGRGKSSAINYGEEDAKDNKNEDGEADAEVKSSSKSSPKRNNKRQSSTKKAFQRNIEMIQAILDPQSFYSDHLKKKTFDVVKEHIKGILLKDGELDEVVGRLGGFKDSQKNYIKEFMIPIEDMMDEQSDLFKFDKIGQLMEKEDQEEEERKKQVEEEYKKEEERRKRKEEKKRKKHEKEESETSSDDEHERKRHKHKKKKKKKKKHRKKKHKKRRRKYSSSSSNSASSHATTTSDESSKGSDFKRQKIDVSTGDSSKPSEQKNADASNAVSSKASDPKQQNTDAMEKDKSATPPKMITMRKNHGTEKSATHIRKGDGNDSDATKETSTQDASGGTKESTTQTHSGKEDGKRSNATKTASSEHTSTNHDVKMKDSKNAEDSNIGSKADYASSQSNSPDVDQHGFEQNSLQSSFLTAESDAKDSEKEREEECSSRSISKSS
jgi:hypothetical protein